MKRIVLFDVDGTLTLPRKKVEISTIVFLNLLKKYTDIGIVGGSDLEKIKEQLGDNLLTYNFFDYVFTENGLISFSKDKCINRTSIVNHLGEDNIKSIVKFVLKYIADLDIPIKRGTFLELRTGMINVSPIGRNCSQEERDDFEKYDNMHQIRKKMIDILKIEFKDLNLVFSIGGQISFDIFPVGWDKTFCLQFLEDYDEIFFFGDKTFEGGNDFEIFTSPKVNGNTVISPENTIKQCTELFMSNN